MSTVESKQSERECTRAWEVEAARDGRLHSKDVHSFLRHLAVCEVCQQRQAKLNALGAILRDLPPMPDDLLAARRMRHRLFAEADQLVLQLPDKPRSRRGLVASAVTIAAAAALVLSFVVRHAAPSAPVAVVAGRADGQALLVNVEAQAGAIWHKTQVGSQVRLDLETGEIRASVGERRPGQSLIIHLPDGEIEDLGTVLTVRVEEGHTASVRVFEGRVRLRLAGSSALELGAGDSWAAPPAPKPEPAPSCSTPDLPATAPQSRSAASSSRMERQSSPPLLENKPGKEAATPTVDAAPPMSPQQAREEDEAYLHVVELVRARRFDAARSAAKDYLLRFPKGFRREEVLGVATSVGR